MMDPYIANIVNSKAIRDGFLSQDISQRLIQAKKMGDEALESLRELSQHSLALVLPHHPSPDVRQQGEVIRQNFKTIMDNQRIIMAALMKLETAFKETIDVTENKENNKSDSSKIKKSRKNRRPESILRVTSSQNNDSNQNW